MSKPNRLPLRTVSVDIDEWDGLTPEQIQSRLGKIREEHGADKEIIFRVIPGYSETALRYTVYKVESEEEYIKRVDLEISEEIKKLEKKASASERQRKNAESQIVALETKLHNLKEKGKPVES